MNRAFVVLAGAFGVIIAVSTLVFSLQLGLSPLDAIYFVITTITTVGYGDYSLRDADPAVKVFGILLMLSGPGFIALCFGFITDRTLPARLRHLSSALQLRSFTPLEIPGAARPPVLRGAKA